MANLFNTKRRKDLKDKERLRLAVKKLRKREAALEDKIKKHKPGKTGKARKKMRDELKVTRAQRRKGQKMLKELEAK